MNSSDCIHIEEGRLVDLCPFANGTLTYTAHSDWAKDSHGGFNITVLFPLKDLFRTLSSTYPLTDTYELLI